jgi:hypothetical protein
MSFSCSKWFVLAFTLAVRGLSQEIPADMPQVTINLYNDARVPVPVLTEARLEAAKIFHRAEVRIAWIDCSSRQALGTSDPACENPRGPSHLVLRIVPWSFKSSDSVFGVAFLSLDGEGTYGNVFYDSVEKLHAEWHSGIASVLGHVMAHEIGHLLLGTNAHSRVGIMCSNWHGKELRNISMGTLLFTPPQVEVFKVRLSALHR